MCLNSKRYFEDQIISINENMFRKNPVKMKHLEITKFLLHKEYFCFNHRGSKANQTVSINVGNTSLTPAISIKLNSTNLYNVKFRMKNLDTFNVIIFKDKSAHQKKCIHL